MPTLVPVTFVPHDRTAWVESGSTLLQAAREAGVRIEAPCAGRGVCGGCGVRVEAGSLEKPDAAEREGLRRAPADVRLACRARVHAPVSVRPVVLTGAVARASEVRPASPGSSACAAAVDLGTTSVAASIIDLSSRLEIGRSVVRNRQSPWGADVVSRIAAARDGAAAELQAAAEESVLEALGAACNSGGARLSSVVRLVIAGNTAMSSLLLGADVESLSRHPFEMPYRGSAHLHANSALTNALAPGAHTLVLPPLGGFVGGDALAGALAVGLDATDETALLVDLGTNAELVLRSGPELLVASAAAGPAFEGVGLTSGGPATPGAIEGVRADADGNLAFDVVGGVRAEWLCGSGLVSLVALLRDLGHLDRSGRFLREGPLAERFRQVDGVEAFEVLGEDEAAGQAEILLSQTDVRSFQLAKGAVLAATETLLERLAPADAAGVREVVVAGNFGSALCAEDLIGLGVLPVQFAEGVRAAGNASLAGASMIAVDPGLEAAVSRLAGTAQHVDLAAAPGFSRRYLGAFELEPNDIA